MSASRLWTLGLIVLGFASCDSSKPKPPPVTAPVAPPPAPVLFTRPDAAASQPATPSVAVAPQVQNRETAAPKAEASSKPSALPTNRKFTPSTYEPLENRFAITATQERFIVENGGTHQVTAIPKANGANGFLAESLIADAIQSPKASPTAAAPKTIPKGFRAATEFGYHETGWPMRILCEKEGITMIFIPAGVAVVGSDDGPVECRPRFESFTQAFYMDQFEVTLGQFRIFTEDQRAKKRTVPSPPLNESDPSPRPALGITSSVAMMYAKWAGKELPYEAEFERAARGDAGLRTVWGDSPASWNKPRAPETISDVGSFPNDCSPFGIYDLAGNAQEWCLDWLGDHGHEATIKAASNGPLKNWPGPKQPGKTGHRVVKGSGSDWSAWNRRGLDPVERDPRVGFRCVIRIPAP